MDEPVIPAQRKDARANRQRILDAARAAFDTAGADVSMAEVARRASIGQATLYRNFSDRRALLEALYSDGIAAISDAAATIDGATDLERLQRWLRRFSDYIADKQALAGALLQHTGPEDAVFSSGYRRISAAGGALVDAAHRSGQLRRDVSLEQIFALVGAIGGVRGDAAFTQPLLEIVLDGLRSPDPSSRSGAASRTS